MARAIKPMIGDKQIKAVDETMRSNNRLKASSMLARKLTSRVKV
jgi:hypothetical protein